MELAIGVISSRRVEVEQLVLVRLGKGKIRIGVSDMLPRHVRWLVDDFAVRAGERVLAVGLVRYSYMDSPLLASHLLGVQSIGSEKVVIQLTNLTFRVVDMPAW